MNVSSRYIPKMALSQGEKYFAICATAFLIPLILGGNLLVMTSYKTNRRLKTRTYTFLINLAVSDVIVGGVNLPMWVYCMVNYQKCISSPNFGLVFKFLDRFGAYASIFHLTAISIERYIAVVKPYLFQRLPKRMFLGVSVVAWIFSLMMASLTWLNVAHDHQKILTFATSLIGFAIPAFIVISMYLGIFLAARSLMKRTPALYGSHKNSHRNSIFREDHKVAVTAAVISGLFIVAWLPFFSLSVIASFCPKKCVPGNTADVLRMVTAVKWLHYSNSGVNPIVYALRDEEMKSSFKRILRIKRLRKSIRKPCFEPDRYDRNSATIETVTSVPFISHSSKKTTIVELPV